MSDWWSADPVAPAAKGGDNWWHADPVASAAAPSLSAGETAADVAKSLPLGLAKGTIGAPGDLATLGGMGVDWAAKKLMSPEQFAIYQANQGSNPLPTSQDIGKAVGYTPQSPLGEGAQTVGGFLPAMLGGPGSLLGKFATRVALPALGSEAAGKATEGTAAEPVARIFGGLAGGLAGSLRAAPAAAEAATGAELKAAAQAGYKSPEVAAVAIRPQAVSGLAAQIRNDLASPSGGFRPITAPKTFSLVDELNVPRGVKSVSVEDLDSARKALGNISREVDAVGAPTVEAAAASRAVSHIDKFLPNLKQPDLLAGDAAKANAILTEARGNYKAYKQSQLADTKMENARIQAASTYGGGNINNALRQAYRPLEMNNNAKTANWSPAAQAALKDVVEGSLGRNIMRDIGRTAPTGPVNIGLHFGAAAASGGATIPLAAGAYAAKKLGEAGTKRAAANLSNVIRSEAPLSQQRAAALPASQPRLTPAQLAMLSAILGAQQGAGALPIPKAQAPIINFSQ